MRICDEMAQIQVPDRLSEITVNAIYRASKMKKKKKNIKYGILSGGLCLLTGVCVLNCSYPVAARNLPFIGSAFAYIQDNLDFSARFETLAAVVGESTYSAHMSVTLSEIYCDGSNLFISYIMESDKAFSEMAADGYVPYQMGCLADSYIDDGESTYKLVELGSAGLEGIFPDDYTFVGSEYYVLDYKDFPEEFSFNTHISRLELIGTNVSCKNHVIKGNWNFSVPVAVNKSQIAEIEVGKEEMGHTIDSVLVSPVMATIYTSYPDIYGDTVDYSVVVLGDKSDENIGRIAIYGKTDGITKVPREEFDNTISVYVIDNSILERAGKRIPNREDFEEYAIVKAVIHLPIG